MRAHPYLFLGGNELTVDHRTLTYLRLLGAPRFHVAYSAACAAGDGPGYADIYSDVYAAEPAQVECLDCFCEAVHERLGHPAYQDPSYDQAPWFAADRPESEEFLGLVASEITINDVLARAGVPRTHEGASVGKLRINGRVIAVDATMYALSSEGMAYGQRWLAERLAGGSCAEGCAPDDAEVLLSCDPDHFRTLSRVGIVDGPVYKSVVSRTDCYIQSVAFQLLAGNPWLLGDAVEHDSSYLSLADAEATVPGPDLVGLSGLVLTLEAGDPNPVTGLIIRVREGTCAAPGDEVFSVEVTDLPANSTLVLDGGRRERYVILPSGEKVSAVPYLVLAGYADVYDDEYGSDFAVITHPQVCNGETACASVEAPPGATINATTRGIISARIMEL